jgi:hypothetical protein
MKDEITIDGVVYVKKDNSNEISLLDDGYIEICSDRSVLICDGRYSSVALSAEEALKFAQLYMWGHK